MPDTLPANLVQPSRRQVIAGIAGVAAASALPIASATNDIAGMHEEIAQKAKSAADGGSKTLRLLMPNGSGDNLKPIISDFEQRTGIKVIPIETPVDDINTQLALDAINGDSNYDLALPATFGLADLVSSGAIISLSQFAEKHEPARFRDGMLYQIGDSFDGDLYGYQTDGDAYVMFYNQEMLEDPKAQRQYADKYGLALEIPTTWPELDRQMAFFHRTDEKKWGGLLFRTPGYLAWEWWVRFHGKGLWPLSESLEPQIASDAGVQALEEMIEATKHLAPEVHTLGLFENWKRFAKGDIYCNIGWGGTQKFLNGPKSPIKGRLRYGPTPGGSINGQDLLTPYFNWGWNYVVSARSDNPELAYLFTLFACSPDVSLKAVRQRGGFFDPFREAHYLDPTIQEIYSTEFLKVHEQSMRTAIPDLYLAHQWDYFRVLSDWLNRAITGETNPRAALQRAAQQWELITQRTDRQSQVNRWRDLRKKYPAQVRDRLKDLPV